MESAPSIEALRLAIARIETGDRRRLGEGGGPMVDFGCEAIDSRFTLGGLTPGTHQMAAADGADPAAAKAFAYAVLARLLAARPDARALLVLDASAVREAGAPYGPGLHAFGLDPDRLVLVRARDGRAALRVVNDALRTSACEAVLADLWDGARGVDLSATRRFNLAAERSSTLVLLTAPDLAGTSAALTRWRIAAAPSRASKRHLGAPAFAVDLVRNRHGLTGQWRLEWSSHDRAFQSVAAQPRVFVHPPLAAPVAAAIVDGPGAARSRPAIVAGGARRQAG